MFFALNVFQEQYTILCFRKVHHFPPIAEKKTFFVSFRSQLNFIFQFYKRISAVSILVLISVGWWLHVHFKPCVQIFTFLNLVNLRLTVCSNSFLLLLYIWSLYFQFCKVWFKLKISLLLLSKYEKVVTGANQERFQFSVHYTFSNVPRMMRWCIVRINVATFIFLL